MEKAYAIVNIVGELNDKGFTFSDKIASPIIIQNEDGYMIAYGEFDNDERPVSIPELKNQKILFPGINEIRKHGNWFLLDECSNTGVYCSVCHKKVYKSDYANQKIKSKFCPNCGAIMDGEFERY